MEPADSTEWESLAGAMRRTLAQNLTAALTVAGGNSEKNGDSVKKMKLTDLNRKTAIARSTLSKLKNGETANGMQANPDLETICRLAAALNVPPAFLLMSTGDWQRLLGALNGLPAVLASPHLDDAVFAVTGIDKVSVGLMLAKKMGLYSERGQFKLGAEETGARQAEINLEIDSGNEMRRLAILTTTAIAQISAKNRNDMAVLTAIGAMFGANYKSI